MSNLVEGKTVLQWIKESPVIEDVVNLKPALWINEGKQETKNVLGDLPVKRGDMEDANERWERFAPLIQKLFPETSQSKGIIESKLIEIPSMKGFIEKRYNKAIPGRLYIKCDSHLPVAGSIKARGGIYEVLKHAEKLAIENGLISQNEDYSILAEKRYKEFFGRYSLAVGSTGNLGLSIGIIGSALGFKVTVHMSADAKRWKKDLLRSRGVIVIEYSSDYSKAVAEGRKQSMEDPMSYFVDDEHSLDLFLGYSVAAFRLKKQLDDSGIIVDDNHPLLVYLPCGVGGAPGGICFGLKHVFGDNVHCFFAEPTHSPCMLLGLATGKHEKVKVQDFGIDNVTEADGLAVGTPSGLVGRIVDRMLSGVYTVEDDDLYIMLSALKDTHDLMIEPSAAAGLLGPSMIYSAEDGSYLNRESIDKIMDNSTHIAWATGGIFVPEELKEQFYQKGKKLMDSKKQQ